MKIKNIFYFLTILFFTFFFSFNGYADLEEEGIKKKDSQSSKGIYVKKRDSNIFWKVDLDIYHSSNRSLIDTAINTKFYGKLEWNVLNHVSMHSEFVIKGSSGFKQSIYEEMNLEDGIHFLESFIKWEPNIYSYFLLGKIKQNFLEAPLLIDYKTFPAILWSRDINLSKKYDFNSQFILEYAIPTNASEFMKRENQIIRKIPYFLSAMILFKSNELSYRILSIENSLLFFKYSNLSPAIARAGRIYGNTITLYKSDSQFEYDYLGIHNHLKLKIFINNNAIFQIGNNFLHNFLAPKNKNQGERIYASFFYNFNDFLEFKYEGEYFSNQHDSSVAYYNSNIYKHNNRFGFGLNGHIYFYDSTLKLSFGYVYSKAINKERSVLRDSNLFIFSIGTNYVSI